MQVIRDKVGVRLIAEQKQKLAEEGLSDGSSLTVTTAEDPMTHMASTPTHMTSPPPNAAETPRYALADRDAQPTTEYRYTAIDELITGELPKEEVKGGWWEKAKSWIPGQ